MNVKEPLPLPFRDRTVNVILQTFQILYSMKVSDRSSFLSVSERSLAFIFIVRIPLERLKKVTND